MGVSVSLRRWVTRSVMEDGYGIVSAWVWMLVTRLGMEVGVDYYRVY